jgi:hypothetical protein
MLTPENDPAQAQFHPNDTVRLLERHGVHAAGDLGQIIGRFARRDPTWVVSFEGESPCVELRGDEIVLSAA